VQWVVRDSFTFPSAALLLSNREILCLTPIDEQILRQVNQDLAAQVGWDEIPFNSFESCLFLRPGNRKGLG